jgi:hypothetical protein
MKFIEHMPLFIGLLVPSRRGRGDLAFLSTNRIQTMLQSKDITKGAIIGFGYDMEIGLARFKAKALSYVGSVGLGNRVS